MNSPETDNASLLKDFRTLFPEFSDKDAFPDIIVIAKAELANRRINPVRWRNLSDYGRSLMVAHYLALWKFTQLQNKVGPDGKITITAVPGMSSGRTASKTVGALSVSYDTTLGSLADAGFWNLTTYGQEVWQMIGLIGMPGMQF